MSDPKKFFVETGPNHRTPYEYKQLLISAFGSVTYFEDDDAEPGQRKNYRIGIPFDPDLDEEQIKQRIIGAFGVRSVKNFEVKREKTAQ